ncbi:MAG: YicC/YloC family endoribonuclease [Acidobacteriota bacterium]|nr:YicC/YloC family endoribonuclease [Acidobacteriota bacterium]
MLYSMTGYGEAVHDDERMRVGFRVRTVNNKGLDIAVKLPFDLMYMEARLRGIIKNRLYRGRVDVFSEIEIRDETIVPPAPVNMAKLTQIMQMAAQMKERGVSGDLDINTLIRLPDMTTAQRVGFQLPEELENLVADMLNKAIDRLEESRLREGGKLMKDFVKRVGKAREQVLELEKMTLERQQELRDTIEKRVKILMDDTQLDPSRLMQEVVYQADRLDISEEITRMKAHLSTFETLINSDKRPLGKELDFLTQENMRESTTIGNKAKNEWIAGYVVKFKTGFEKIREQLQNIE